MKVFILVFTMLGQQPQYLGEFNTVEACQNGIRQVMMAKVYKGEHNNPQVKAAVETAMFFQQEYQCVPKGRK